MELQPWVREAHLRHIDDGPWRAMYDDAGVPLRGIDGKAGVRALKDDGTYIGGDFIRMQPGSAFPLHTHKGEHVIYFIFGAGFVHINGDDIPVRADQIIHIPAEYPHSVWCAEHPLFFIAIGHPHQHINSTKRMTTVTESRSAPDRTPLAPDHHGS